MLRLRDRPLSLDQERAVQLHEYVRRKGLNALRSVDVAFDVRGRLDAGLLRAALNHLIATQTAFRTSFVPDPDQCGEYRRTALDRLMMRSIVTPALYVQNIASEGSIELEGRPLTGEPAGRVDGAAIASAGRRPVIDFSRPPLMRACLTTRGPSRHVLVLSISRLICDPASVGIIVRDLPAAYAALASGIALPIVRRDEEYAARVCRERAMLQSGGWASFRRYWQEQWATIGADQIEALDLPLAQPMSRAEALTSPHVTEWLTLSPRETLQVDAFSGERWSLLVVFAAASARALGRFTAKTAVPLWVLWPNRTDVGAADMVGSFATSHAVDIDLLGGADDEAYLARVDRALRDAWLRQEYPLEALWIHLGVRHDRSLRAECCVYDERGTERSIGEGSAAFLPCRTPRVALSDAPVQISVHVSNTACRLALSYSMPLLTPDGAKVLLASCRASLMALVASRGEDRIDRAIHLTTSKGAMR